MPANLKKINTQSCRHLLSFPYTTNLFNCRTTFPKHPSQPTRTRLTWTGNSLLQIRGPSTHSLWPLSKQNPTQLLSTLRCVPTSCACMPSPHDLGSSIQRVDQIEQVSQNRPESSIFLPRTGRLSFLSKSKRWGGSVFVLFVVVNQLHIDVHCSVFECIPHGER